MVRGACNTWFNWDTHPYFHTNIEFSLCGLDKIYNQSTTIRILCCQSILIGVVNCLDKCVFVRLHLAEIGIHVRLSLNCVFPSHGCTLTALSIRMGTLPRIRVPKHGPQPYLRIHIHLMQHILPAQVLSHYYRCYHSREFHPEFLHPDPRDLVWRPWWVLYC